MYVLFTSRKQKTPHVRRVCENFLHENGKPHTSFYFLFIINFTEDGLHKRLYTACTKCSPIGEWYVRTYNQGNFLYKNRKPHSGWWMVHMYGYENFLYQNRKPHTGSWMVRTYSHKNFLYIWKRKYLTKIFVTCSTMACYRFKHLIHNTYCN